MQPPRDSTVENKKLFLQYLEKSKGIVTIVCQKIDISRATYYHWLKTDKQFRKEVKEVTKHKVAILEDRLMVVAMDGNASALKYLLSALDPKYKKSNRESTVHIRHHSDGTTSKNDGPFTWEDALLEQARKRKAIAEKHEKVSNLSNLKADLDGSAGAPEVG